MLKIILVRHGHSTSNTSYSIYEYDNGTLHPLLQHHTAHLDNATSTSLQGLV